MDCTLRSLRHYNATQMLAAGIDLRTAAGRLGHAGGGLLGMQEFPATPAGYGCLLGWLGGFGTVCLAGIEGTGR